MSSQNPENPPNGCDDFAEIADALREDYIEACGNAPIPSAGLVWWRTSIRARAEAARQAEQPLTVAPAVAGAAVIGLACGVAGLVWQALPTLPQPSAMMLAALAVGVCVIVAPLALVLALARE